MEKVTVKAELRDTKGSSNARSSRRSGIVPGVIYGGQDVVHFNINPIDLKNVLYTPDFKIVELSLDGKVYPCILKAAQFHPVSEKLLHIDLLELTSTKPFNVEVPLRFSGVSPGVKLGGKFTQKIRKIKVRTTLDKLVPSLNADISKMELGHSIRVRDLQVPEGVAVMNPGAIPIASIEIPRALRNQAG